MAQSNFPNKSGSYGSTISVYSEGNATLKRAERPSPNFLSSVFMSHAVKYNKGKNKIGPY